MIDYILSKTVKKYVKDNHIQLTDREKATLIYNSEYDLESKHESLKELMESTQDQILKTEIQERITEDKNALRTIMSNGSREMYKLLVYEKEDRQDIEQGYYNSFDVAFQFARKHAVKWLKKFTIEKHRVFFMGDDVTEFTDEDEEFMDSCLGYVLYNEYGKLMHYGSGEYEGKFDLYAEKKRFEFNYISFRHPFRRGDLVKHILDGEQGIVFAGSEDIEKVEPFVQRFDGDYSDTSINVEFLYENGEFGHAHVYPWNLEYSELQFHEYRDILEDDLKGCTLKAAQSMYCGTDTIENLQMCCEKMRCKTV